MNRTMSSTPDRNRSDAARRPRNRLPSMPWVECLGFFILIAMTLHGGG